jgi:16S rRNA G966 N2-methylase RsmD
MQDKNRKYRQLIKDNIRTDIAQFTLKNSGKMPKEDLSFVADQIESRRKAKKKFPDWADNYNLIFPKPLSVEQSSSVATAEYKASLFEKMGAGIDLTGGFGLDSFYLAKKCMVFVHNELNAELSAIVRSNYEVLGITNVTFENTDAQKLIEETETHFDMIFIDPARRGGSGNKLYHLADCQPNILEMMSSFAQKTKKLLIKLSPLTDITMAVKQLNEKLIESIHVVSVDNECKELLIMLNFQTGCDEINYYAINISKGKTSRLSLKKSENELQISQPKKYLYEPNTSLMKLGFWTEIGEIYGISAIAPNTHLFTSNEFIDGFAGRTFEIKQEVRANKKEIHKLLPQKKANISTRNYPLSAKDLRKKLQLADGGDDYLFAFRDISGKGRLFLCGKV